MEGLKVDQFNVISIGDNPHDLEATHKRELSFII